MTLKPADTPARDKIGIWRALILAAAGLTGAWFAMALAISGVARTHNPDTALKFVPGEATALAALADRQLAADPQKPADQVRTTAIEALRQQALNPRALRVLGYYFTAKRQERLAGDYIRLAAGQSRREVTTQLWLIEDSVQKNDLDQALVHYDIALRTKSGTYVLLFPILLSALDDPAIRTALKPYVHSDRSWVQSFLTHANANSNNLPALVDLIVESGGFGVPDVARAQNLELLARLVAEKRFADARRLYLHMPGAKPAQLVDAGFQATDRDGSFGPMGWQASINPESGSSFAKGDGERTLLTVYANPATTATVATRILYLQPGQYDFAAKLSALDAGERGSIRWQVRCPNLDSERPVWTLDSASTAVRASLTLPAGCPVQFIDIVPSGGAGQAGLEATVNEVSLRRRQ